MLMRPRTTKLNIRGRMFQRGEECYISQFARRNIFKLVVKNYGQGYLSTRFYDKWFMILLEGSIKEKFGTKNAL